MNAIVTGATRGIGRAIAYRMAAAHYHLVLCARNESSLLDLKSSLETEYPECRIFVKPTDMSIKGQVLEFAEFAKSQFDSIDVLVNNAGLFVPTNIANAKDGDLEQLIATNLYSAYWLTQAILPNMMARKTGDIINICSIASLKAYEWGSNYTITKHALHGFSKALREEMKPHGIRVCSVLPGAVYTSAWDTNQFSPDKMMKADDIAETVFSILQLSHQTVVEDIVLRPILGDL